MFCDASLYDSRRQLQNRDTIIFLDTFVRRMDWSRQEQDVVMDVGCGPGGSCQKLYLPAFPRVKKMIGVDIMECMIDYAKKNNTDERIEFYVANIEDRPTVEKWFNQMTKVISVFCLHWLRSIEKGLSNVYHLLKPGGEAALLIALTCPVWDSYELLYSNPKWKKYIANVCACIPESNSKKYATGYYCSLLENIGFKVICSEYLEKTYAYLDDNDCREFWYACSPFSNHIPDELTEDFKDDLLKGFLKFNGRNSEGKPLLSYSILEVLLKKPDSSEQRSGPWGGA